MIVRQVCALAHSSADKAEIANNSNSIALESLKLVTRKVTEAAPWIKLNANTGGIFYENRECPPIAQRRVRGSVIAV